MEHFGICRNADNSSMFINNDLLTAVTPIDIFALPSCVTGNKTPELNKNLLVKKQILYILNIKILHLHIHSVKCIGQKLCCFFKFFPYFF